MVVHRMIPVFFVPIKGTTAIGVSPAIQADFRTVIRARHTGKHILEGNGVAHPAFIPTAGMNKPRRVVGIEQVEHAFVGLLGVAHQAFRYPSAELFGIHAVFGIMQNARFLYGIVHHAVPDIALEPRFRVPPAFPDNQAFGVDGTHPFPEFTPEGVFHFIGHIQPPGINAAARPFFYRSQ